jgi:hypothetical protein
VSCLLIVDMITFVKR